MRTVKDLTDEELINLTDEEIEALVTVQLMHEGIVVPEAPVRPEREPDYSDLPTKTYVKIQGNGYGAVLLANAEDVEKLRGVRILRADYTRQRQGKYHYTAEETQWEIGSMEIYDRDDLAKRDAELVEVTARYDTYLADLKEYERAVEKKRKVVDDIYSTIYDARTRKAKADNIHATFEKYVGLADGDEHVAWRFLCKAYDSDEIDMLKAWYPDYTELEFEATE